MMRLSGSLVEDQLAGTRNLAQMTEQAKRPRYGSAQVHGVEQGTHHAQLAVIPSRLALNTASLSVPEGTMAGCFGAAARQSLAYSQLVAPEHMSRHNVHIHNIRLYAQAGTT